MSQEERKMVRIFTQWGGNFGILTRMPYAEIEDELFNPDNSRDLNWIKLVGVDEKDNTVNVWIPREDRRVVIINKYAPNMVQPVSSAIQ